MKRKLHLERDPRPRFKANGKSKLSMVLVQENMNKKIPKYDKKSAKLSLVLRKDLRISRATEICLGHRTTKETTHPLGRGKLP